MSLTLQYIISGGQLKIDKMAFAREIILPESPMNRIIHGKGNNSNSQPKITKSENYVIIDFNDSSDIILDEGFYDLFKKLKLKYKERLKGKVVIRITALTSYHVILDLNSEDDKVIYE